MGKVTDKVTNEVTDEVMNDIQELDLLMGILDETMSSDDDRMCDPGISDGMNYADISDVTDSADEVDDISQSSGTIKVEIQNQPWRFNNTRFERNLTSSDAVDPRDVDPVNTAHKQPHTSGIKRNITEGFGKDEAKRSNKTVLTGRTYLGYLIRERIM